MATLDLIIILIYIVLLFIVGIVVGLKENAEDFLILSRKARAPLVLFSMVSTWVGVGAFVGSASGGYDTGISVGVSATAAALIGVIAVLLFTPVMKRFGDRFQAHTIGDFFRIRYSKANQILVGTIVILTYFLFTAAQFTGLAILLRLWTSLNFEITIIIAAITTIIYTAFAGIKSDFYTDVVHFWVMVLVLFGMMLPIVLHSIGGLATLKSLPTSYFNPFAYGGVTFFIGNLIFGAGSTLISMEVWQKIYASKSAKTAKIALSLSIILIISFYLLSVFFGMSAKFLYPGLPNRDMAIFTLMRNQLPTGFLGLGVAAFLAVFISSVNTMIMVVSATLTKDFYKGIFKPQASDKQMLRVGRITTLIAGIIGLIISLIIKDILVLVTTGLLMLLVLLPAIVGGFFWKKANATASFISVLIGFLLAVVLWPKMAAASFVPGFFGSLILFVLLSFFTKHSKLENIKLSKDN